MLILKKVFFSKNFSRSNNYEILDRIIFSVDYRRNDGNPTSTFVKPKQLDHVEGAIFKLGIKEEDLVTSCSFNKKPCSLSKVLTPDGLCYAFNLIDPEEMFNQNLYFIKYSSISKTIMIIIYIFSVINNIIPKEIHQKVGHTAMGLKMTMMKMFIRCVV